MNNRRPAFCFSMLELVMRAFDAHQMPTFALKTTNDVATVGEHVAYVVFLERRSYVINAYDNCHLIQMYKLSNQFQQRSRCVE